MTFVRRQPFAVRPYRLPMGPILAPTETWQLPQGPVDLEIGCGVGLHPLRYARQNPDRHLIAIEKTSAKFARFSRRLERHPDVSNLSALQADAVQWVIQHLPDSTIERMFLLYPNPNPLARSANRRWHQMPFFAKLAAVLKPGGTLTLATNIEAYAAEAEQFIQTIWGLRLIQRQAIRAGEIIPRTHFEKKYLARGETCWNLIFQKP